MANNLIEEQILKGRGRISLLADGHDIEEINDSLETIEKKNPSLTEVNLGATDVRPVEDSASTLDAGSSGSSLTSEPTRVIGFFDEPIEGSDEDSIPLPTVEDRAFFDSVGSITEKVMNATERANYLYQFGQPITEGIEGRPQDLTDPSKVLEAARRMKPEERKFYASARLDIALNLRASEDQDYLDRIETIDTEIKFLQERIDADDYQPTVVGGMAGPTSVTSGLDKKRKDQEQVEALYHDKTRITHLTKARYQADDLEEAYRLITEEPEKWTKSKRTRFGPPRKTETTRWLDWASKMQELEESLFNHGHGIAIDIDDDGKTGLVHRGKDTMLALELMGLTTLDIAMYTAFTVQEVKDGVFDALSGGYYGEAFGDINRTQEDFTKNYANWSDRTRKQIRSRYTKEMVTFEEELLMGDAEWYEGLFRWQNLFNAIESSPYSAIALTTLVATGNT